MNSVPVVFAIDNNVVMQCGVTITSLLKNAKSDTFYDFFVLCNEHDLSPENKDLLLRAFKDTHSCRISFVDVGNAFDESDGLATGHITTATYYRLAIPTLFPQYDKVIYADVDMIFQQDLNEVFCSSLQNGEFLAAVLDLAIDDKFFFRSNLSTRIGIDEKCYFNAGFLVMNLKLLRSGTVLEELNRHAKIKYEMNDQDVLNIVCNGKVQILPTIYNFQLNHFSNYMWGRKSTEIQFGELFKKATLHYTWKNKPWNSLECVAYDTWWHYYKMSPFYDDMYYFKRQYEQIEAARDDYRNIDNKRLFTRIFVNIKRKLLK